MNLRPRSLMAIVCVLVFHAVPGGIAGAQSKEHAKSDEAISPALTIYNQQFAVVRNGLTLDLKPGQNHVEVTDISGHLEPDSVMLRSLDEGRRLRILEQNYRNDPVSEQLLLSLYEGKTIDFRSSRARLRHAPLARRGQTAAHSRAELSQRSCLRATAAVALRRQNNRFQVISSPTPSCSARSTRADGCAFSSRTIATILSPSNCCCRSTKAKQSISFKATRPSSRERLFAAASSHTQPWPTVSAITRRRRRICSRERANR